MTAAPSPTSMTGSVLSVRGAVIDVDFASGVLPAIDTSLLMDWDRLDTLAPEVHIHADPSTVRAIALQATSGLPRCHGVRATGTAISLLVGERRDRSLPLPPGTPRRGIHARPPALDDGSASISVFGTGTKVIDLLAPLAESGNTAMLGGARARTIHAMAGKYRGMSMFAGVGERSREGRKRLTDMKGFGVPGRSVSRADTLAGCRATSAARPTTGPKFRST